MPKGYPKNKTVELSAQAQAIKTKISELEERLKAELTFGKKRKALLSYCERNKFTRSDLYAAAAQLPLLRITKKQRLKRAEEEKNKKKGG